MANEYDEGRCWIKKSGKHIQVGLTSAALDEVGQVEKVNLPTEGDFCEEGDVIVEVEGSLSTLEMVAPVNGIIVLVNEALNDAPEIVSEDPTDEGWILKIQVQASDEDDRASDDDEEEEEVSDDEESESEETEEE